MNLNLEDEEEVVDPITLKPALYAAAKDDDPRTVMDLLEKKVPTTYVDESGWTALHWAAKNGNAKMVRALLDHHASDPYHFVKAEAAGKSFLQRAKAPLSEEKRSEASEMNADLSEVESREAFEATLRRRALEDMGTDLSDNFVKNTPLLWACFKGHLYIVWMLLLDGYSPNDRDDMGNTSLHLAAAAGVVKVVELLIQDGVSANIVNIYKNLPIDTTTDSSIREMLVVAMTKFASMTAEESALKHEANMNAVKNRN